MLLQSVLSPAPLLNWAPVANLNPSGQVQRQDRNRMPGPSALSGTELGFAQPYRRRLTRCWPGLRLSFPCCLLHTSPPGPLSARQRSKAHTVTSRDQRSCSVRQSLKLNSNTVLYPHKCATVHEGRAQAPEWKRNWVLVRGTGLGQGLGSHSRLLGTHCAPKCRAGRAAQ